MHYRRLLPRIYRRNYARNTKSQFTQYSIQAASTLNKIKQSQINPIIGSQDLAPTPRRRRRPPDERDGSPVVAPRSASSYRRTQSPPGHAGTPPPGLDRTRSSTDRRRTRRKRRSWSCRNWMDFETYRMTRC